MQFFFIRHGESTNNALWNERHCSDARCADPELTQQGWEQSRRLGAFLKSGDPLGGKTTSGEVIGFGLTHLYCSLMIRSTATGWVVSQTLDIPLQAWEDTHEEGGIYLQGVKGEKYVGQSGKNRSYFESQYPGMILPDNLGEAGWWDCRPFEEPEACSIRARRFLDQLLERHGETDDRVAVISHIGFYNNLLGAILCGQSKLVWARLNNSGITRIDFTNGLVDLVYMNRSDFLPTSLIT
jgi:2,3-bisphosphoglycerate-dependent phosphoglycerate mutase